MRRPFCKVSRLTLWLLSFLRKYQVVVIQMKRWFDNIFPFKVLDLLIRKVLKHIQRQLSVFALQLAETLNACVQLHYSSNTILNFCNISLLSYLGYRVSFDLYALLIVEMLFISHTNIFQHIFRILLGKSSTLISKSSSSLRQSS